MASNGLPHRWSVADSTETYGIQRWSNGYFSINDAGHVVVHPGGPGTHSLDLKHLVDEVHQRGYGLPLLLRFPDILRSRIIELNEAFRRAIQEYGYRGAYCGVYPIKVNQDRGVVEEVVKTGERFNYGLEAGSKPELMAVIAMLEKEEPLIICNGYKDEEYVEMALLASRLGRTILLVVEKLSELSLIAAISKKTGIRPRIGLRVKLSSRGSGRWESSAGDRSKFGLSSHEVVDAVRILNEANLLDCLQLLHFHLGSQISAIRSVKDAVKEASRFYVELTRMGANFKYLDVGGGLGVDYDGSQTNFDSSMNYTLQEYANDIVYSVLEACNAARIEHPNLVSESGRAVVAHHAVLVINVLGRVEFATDPVPERPPEGVHPRVRSLMETYQECSRKNLLECFHDSLDDKDEVLSLFSLGQISLEQRVLAENAFWGLCQKIHRLLKDSHEVPEDLVVLERALSDTYFCNFSVFQSLPDSWAVEQLFPVMPIHRLNEEPTRRAVLADITCDSDGGIDKFIDRRDVKPVLELHPLTEADYHLGIFLVGAYQEILGDLHNLFGDTNAVSIALVPDGGYTIDHVEEGDTVTDVLNYVAYSKNDVLARVRRATEVALRQKRMSLEESRVFLEMYDRGMDGYTYLEG
ncbi:MAG: biosynthetic arginine decarboxylase [Planctomycetes bacterium]|nr:biosynthetic arginine decarboxylase [Planctomycetota bacterium]